MRRAWLPTAIRSGRSLQVYPNGCVASHARGDVAEPTSGSRSLRALIRGYRFMNQRYAETKEILTKAGYQLDKDMDAALWEGKYHMFERVPRDGGVNETGLKLVIDEEKAAGKLPPSFKAEDILINAVRAVTDSGNTASATQRVSYKWHRGV
jgi:hypothetical protein